MSHRKTPVEQDLWQLFYTIYADYVFFSRACWRQYFKVLGRCWTVRGVMLKWNISIPQKDFPILKGDHAVDLWKVSVFLVLPGFSLGSQIHSGHIADNRVKNRPFSIARGYVAWPMANPMLEITDMEASWYGVPPSHLFLRGLSSMNHPAIGIPLFQEATIRISKRSFMRWLRNPAPSLDGWTPNKIRDKPTSVFAEGGSDFAPIPSISMKQNSIDWFKGKSKPETIDFPMNYGSFL